MRWYFFWWFCPERPGEFVMQLHIWILFLFVPGRRHILLLLAHEHVPSRSITLVIITLVFIPFYFSPFDDILILDVLSLYFFLVAWDDHIVDPFLSLLSTIFNKSGIMIHSLIVLGKNKFANLFFAVCMCESIVVIVFCHVYMYINVLCVFV